MVVNNGAAAVTLAVAAIACGRQVVVSRGESVEIGGRFRIPDMITTSGARLCDVGTTNRTHADDFRAAIDAPGADVACVLRVHTSNFRVEGFTTQPTVQEVATLGVPVVVDIGSGLVDADCPWLAGGPPPWLRGEPAARQALASGATLVTFSGDKLLGGPQAGILVGAAEAIEACARHPLARIVRPGSHVLAGMQEVALRYLRGDAASLPFWSMVTTPTSELARRASAIVDTVAPLRLDVATSASEAVPGAGSRPGVTIPSIAVVIPGDHLPALRRASVPVIARVSEGATWCDLRAVTPTQDARLAEALAGLVTDG
jgi:L-seryl-tRNA(Ser) seleniumtransferase